jgi:hypothetical protein
MTFSRPQNTIAMPSLGFQEEKEHSSRFQTDICHRPDLQVNRHKVIHSALLRLWSDTCTRAWTINLLEINPRKRASNSSCRASSQQEKTHSVEMSMWCRSELIDESTSPIRVKLWRTMPRIRKYERQEVAICSISSYYPKMCECKVNPCL